jgi:hypothetical protein
VVIGFPIGDILRNREAMWTWCSRHRILTPHRNQESSSSLALVALVLTIESRVSGGKEDVLWWVIEVTKSRGWYPFHRPWRRLAQICTPTIISCLQQRYRIWSLIHGLNIVVSLGIKILMVYGDYLVVISQLNMDWDCSAESMTNYYTGKLRTNLKG